MSYIVTWVSAIAATAAAGCAYLSLRLSKKIYDDLKSDEELIFSPIHHPEDIGPSYSKSVLYFTVFNKSKRKAYIKDIKVLNRKNEEIEINWSDSVSNIGNVEKATGLVGIIDSVNIYLRRKDGADFDEAILSLQHSFSESREKLQYNEYQWLTKPAT